jgi:hypothetical protein
MAHKILTEKIIEAYNGQNPYCTSVLNLFKQQGEDVFIDHISYRTFDFPHINTDVLSVPLIEVGYHEVERYKYENQNIKARYYEHQTDKSAPLIYISELSIHQLSRTFYSYLKEMVDNIPIEILCSEKILYTPNIWGKPSYEIYKKFKSESDYAAGVYVNGLMPQHLSVRLNKFKKFETIKKASEFLSQNEISTISKNYINQDHNIPLLEQIMINMGNVLVSFEEGDFEIPSSYLEFTKRNFLSNSSLFTGFIPNMETQKACPMTLEQINEMLLEDI